MSQQDRIDYHARRADEEQERGRSTDAPDAAQAHHRLADLHLQRAEQLRNGAAK